MSEGVSDADSSGTCSQELTSISNDSDTFSTQDSTSSVDSADRIYVNLADLHSSTTPTKTLQGVSEALMASQGMLPKSKSPNDARPPPLPKKTLNRTNSAPGGVLLGSPLTKSLPCSPGFQITNPLYGIYEGKNMIWTKNSFSSPCSPLKADEKFNLWSLHSRRAGMTKAQSLDGNPGHVPQMDIGKLNFETSDLDLRNWINTDSQEEVFRTLANRCTMSLRSIAAKYSRLFLRDKEPALNLSESDWPGFQVPFDKPCCVSRDAVYYRAQYMQDEFTLKISKTLNQEPLEKEPDGLSVQESLPVHFNVQQVRGHFMAALPTNLSPTEEAVLCADVPESEVSGVETGAAAETSEANPESQLDKTRQFVIITQETPFQTMADFVNESASLHVSQAEVYERQISLLLLQLCLGLEHLKNQGVIHCDLRLENLLLVKMPGQVANPGSQAQDDILQLPRLVISNFSKAKQRNTAVDQKHHPDLARQAPEMMSTSQYKMVDEFQLGILIYEVLHMPNPFESISRLSEDEEYNTSDLPLICPLSAYSEGLQHLAHLLLRADPYKRIHIREAKSILQALLWGPCSKAFSVKTGLRDSPHVLKNWLDVKRVLLVLKFGEWFLDEQSQTTLEDWLCCQYFALATPESMFQAVEKMQILLEEKC
ncbi:protein PEAK3 isoform X1 [Amblyraja radiata]|uniref:protein PEAK3 isoform X1 n=1 Tax=Amblyraja radiata TaxID=386614 RepID=UPI0014028CE5|nr:protein PEAK3 isoform X1 [Amblyraja radiata]